MDHEDHLDLLRPGIIQPGGIWADFGSGRGAFTLALAELLGPGSEIYSIDRDERALEVQGRQLRRRFPDLTVQTLAADFAQPLELPLLDGLLMANSLHFFVDKEALVRLLKDYLRPNGRFLLVEYDTDQGNPWVPHPLSFQSWQSLAQRSGLKKTKRLGAKPSRFLGSFFSAVSYV